MTTNFKPGDRVACYTSGGRLVGEVYRPKNTDGMIAVVIDGETGLKFFHHKQLRRLKKRKRVVWESGLPIQTGYYEQNTAGCFISIDGVVFHRKLAEFVGKRVRIVITEAKPQDKGER